MGWIMGLEESGPPEGRVKKCPVDTFLARGRVPFSSGASRQGCERRKGIDGMDMRLERAAAASLPQKQSGGLFLARGRVPRRKAQSGMACTPRGVPLLFWNGYGTRKAVKKTCRWHVFRPWESPFCARTHPLGVWAGAKIVFGESAYKGAVFALIRHGYAVLPIHYGAITTGN